MRPGRTVLVALALAAAAWTAFALLGDDDPAFDPGSRPGRLTVAEGIETVEISGPGRVTVVLDVDDGTLVPASPVTGVGRDELSRLHDDLLPLLTVREVEGPDAEYGLDPPSFTVHLRGSATPTITIRIGDENFDGTAHYATDGMRTGLVLDRIVDTLEALAPLR